MQSRISPFSKANAIPDEKIRELLKKIESIEKNLSKKDEEIQIIFKILKELVAKDAKPTAREPIGFVLPKKK